MRARNWLGREMIASALGHEEWRFKGGAAIDSTGAEVVHLDGERMTCGGRELRMEGGRAGLTTARAPIALLEGDRELARFEPKMWARDRPPQITIVDEEFAREEPLLLLYAAYAAPDGRRKPSVSDG